MKTLLLVCLLGTTACGIGKEIRDVKSAIAEEPKKEPTEEEKKKEASKKAEEQGETIEKVESKKAGEFKTPSRQKFEITPDGCKALDAKAFDTPYGLKAFVLANCGGSNKVKMADQKRGAKEYNFKAWENVESCFNVKSFDVAQNGGHFAIVTQCADGANGIASKIVVLDNESGEFNNITEYKEKSSFQGIRASAAFNKKEGAFLASIGSKVFSFDNVTVLMDFDLGQVPSSQVKRLSPVADGYVATTAVTGGCSFISQGLERSGARIADLHMEKDSFVVAKDFAVSFEHHNNKITVYKLSTGSCEATKINEYISKQNFASIVSALAVNDDQVVVSMKTLNGGLLAVFLSDEAGNFEEAVGGKTDNMHLFMIEGSVFAAYADGANAWIVETK